MREAVLIYFIIGMVWLLISLSWAKNNSFDWLVKAGINNFSKILILIFAISIYLVCWLPMTVFVLKGLYSKKKNA